MPQRRSGAVRPGYRKITSHGRSKDMKIRGQDKIPESPAAITVTLDGDLLAPEQMRLAESLAEALLQETAGMRPQGSQDGDEVTVTPNRVAPGKAERC